MGPRLRAAPVAPRRSAPLPPRPSFHLSRARTSTYSVVSLPSGSRPLASSSSRSWGGSPTCARAGGGGEGGIAPAPLAAAPAAAASKHAGRRACMQSARQVCCRRARSALRCAVLHRAGGSTQASITGGALTAQAVAAVRCGSHCASGTEPASSSASPCATAVSRSREDSLLRSISVSTEGLRGGLGGGPGRGGRDGWDGVGAAPSQPRQAAPSLACSGGLAQGAVRWCHTQQVAGRSHGT
jgi:hypothetical protein